MAVVKLAVLLTCPCSAWIDWTERAAQPCPFGTSQTSKGRSASRRRDVRHPRFLPVTDDAVRWHLTGHDGHGRDFVGTRRENGTRGRTVPGERYQVRFSSKDGAGAEPSSAVLMCQDSAIRTASPCASRVARPTACHPERSEGSRQLPEVQRLTNNCRDPSLRSG